MNNLFLNFSQGMQNIEDDFLSLSLPGYPSDRARLTPPINPPQAIQAQPPALGPSLAPSNHNTNNVAHHVTTLSLATPLLIPYAGADTVQEHALSCSHPAPAVPAKSEIIRPPFAWATNRRAMVHSHKYLVRNMIFTITGSVRCRRCGDEFEMKLDIESKLGELLRFIRKNKDIMHDRAPKGWVCPVLPKCQHCARENSVEPILKNTKKKAINWLFLLLSQLLGCCTIKQLKYFCKHNSNHRTGAKDRLVYATYMGLCKQLLPDLFD